MQIVPTDFVMFQNVTHQIVCIQCIKKLINPITITEYSLFSKSSLHLQRSPNRTSGGKFNIFLAKSETKISLRMHTNTPFQVKNYLLFLGRGLASSPGEEGYTSPHPTSIKVPYTYIPVPDMLSCQFAHM